MFSGIRHIFFDLDDTLWDFEKNSVAVLEQLFGEFSLSGKLNTTFNNFHSTYKEVNREFWSLYTKGAIDKQYLRNHRFNEAFKKFSYDNYEENLLVTEQYLLRSPHGTHLKDGCMEVLNYLKEKDYKLHIITNGFKEVQHIKLNNCGLKPYFSTIIISEEHQVNKPSEGIFRLSEELAGCTRKECVMIGDNFESDVEGALNAGWKAIYFSESLQAGYKGQSINALSELKTLF